ncbi:hypothetical protein LTR51_002331 [Lithohypha guttulata]|nr:hypothetical protein LTR51_002331 [Lithohypha guttulata]
MAGEEAKFVRKPGKTSLWKQGQSSQTNQRFKFADHISYKHVVYQHTRYLLIVPSLLLEMRRLRVLCLHGFTSNGQVHAHQLRRITQAMPEYDFLFPDGPHNADVASIMDMTKPENQDWTKLVNELSTSGHKAWWFARDGNWQNVDGGYVGLEESLDFVGSYMKEKGPIHAIWGFSQGACFAGMLCALLQGKLSNHPLRKHLPPALPTPIASVVFSGFRARFPQYDSIYEPGIDVPMLHVMGQDDPLVNSERSETLIKIFETRWRA